MGRLSSGKILPFSIVEGKKSTFIQYSKVRFDRPKYVPLMSAIRVGFVEKEEPSCESVDRFGNFLNRFKIGYERCRNSAISIAIALRNDETETEAPKERYSSEGNPLLHRQSLIKFLL